MSLYVAMHLKWKLKACTVQIELEKIGFVRKNFFFNLSWFWPNAQGPPKIFDVKFLKFFKKETPKLASWNMAIIKRNKVRKFGFVTAADGFMVGGAIMAPLGQKGSTYIMPQGDRLERSNRILFSGFWMQPFCFEMVKS